MRNGLRSRAIQRAALAIFLVALACTACFTELRVDVRYPDADASVTADGGARRVGGPSLTPGLGPSYVPPLFGSGTSGTYTVPAGDYVLGVFTHTTSGGTLVMTCNTQQITDAGALPTITLPAGGALNLGPPFFASTPYTCADASTLVFTGTDSYVVWLVRYVYP